MNPEDTAQEKPTSQQMTETGSISNAAFDLPIPDDDLADIIDKRVKESQEFYKTKLKLEARQKINEDFWVGRQFDESKFYDYQIPYKDNIIWQDLETRISIIASRMPDIVVTPNNNDTEKIKAAQAIQKGLKVKIDSSTTRRLVKNGLRNHHLDFIGCLKIRWDKDTNDYLFEVVKPQKLVLDHTATIPADGFTADNMEFIAEYIEEPVAQTIAKFPGKEDEILKANHFVKGTSKQMNSKNRYQEVWFSFYGADGELYEGTCWKMGKTILDKQKNPYYDWEGYEREAATGKETSYRNHFDRPRKPYIFFSYQNLGYSPIDDTTPVEQAIPLQKIINKRGRQITEISDRAVPKLVFTGDAMTKEDARNVTNDPDEHIVLNQNVQDARAAVLPIAATPPSSSLYQDMILNRTQIDAKFATHSTTRGEQVPSESGISKQITREGDLAVADDMSSIVVERVVYEMSNWAVQLMKLFYDKEHFLKDVGKDGEVSYVTLKRDLIDDGLEINVKASSVDKAQRRFDAQNSAARRLIDPLTYYEDLDVPNPKQRAKRLIAFLSGQFGVYSDITELSIDLKDVGDEEALIDIDRLKNNEKFDVGKITPAYLQRMIQFVGSDEYKELNKSIKDRFKEFIKILRDKARKQASEQLLEASKEQQTQPMPNLTPGQVSENV